MSLGLRGGVDKKILSPVAATPQHSVSNETVLSAVNAGLKQVNRNVKGVTQSQTAANPRHQEENLTSTKQTNKCTRSTQTSSLFPKRGDHNAKRNDETRGQRARIDFKT